MVAATNRPLEETGTVRPIESLGELQNRARVGLAYSLGRDPPPILAPHQSRVPHARRPRPGGAALLLGRAHPGPDRAEDLRPPLPLSRSPAALTCGRDGRDRREEPRYGRAVALAPVEDRGPRRHALARRGQGDRIRHRLLGAGRELPGGPDRSAGSTGG